MRRNRFSFRAIYFQEVMEEGTFHTLPSILFTMKVQTQKKTAEKQQQPKKNLKITRAYIAVCFCLFLFDFFSAVDIEMSTHLILIEEKCYYNF